MIAIASYYTHGSAAKKIQYDVFKENKVLKNKKIRKSFRKVKMKIVCLVLFLFLCSLITMYRYAQITDLNYKINEAQKQFSILQNDNLKQRVEIERSLDLSYVREVAVSKFGMHKPERYQMVSVSVPKTDYVKYSEKALEIAQKQGFNTGVVQAGVETKWK